MRVDVVTLFPELFDAFLATSMVGRAVASGALAVRRKSPRDFGKGRHKSVDDTPYGGGSGMVMRVDCIVDCLEALDAGRAGADEGASPPTLPLVATPGEPATPTRAHRVLLCPQGAPFRQRTAHALVERGHVALVCGRYEGFDDRVRSFVDEEVSLGDFVLSGLRVPDVLSGGNHAVIDAWRRAEAERRTRERRPDLWAEVLEGRARAEGVGR
jgi:tRNA (guanine37-N1)-methyltransferase